MNYNDPNPVFLPMMYDPQAPYGRDPFSGAPLSSKSKVVAGVLQLTLGCFGTGRWYVGQYGIASAQLALFIVGWLTLIVMIGFPLLLASLIWSLIDGLVFIAGHPVDRDGRLLR